MVSRVRRIRPAPVEEVEDVAEVAESEELEAGGNEKATLDRIEQRYRDRADSPLRAIRAFCVLCMGCQPRMVADCTATKCVLYPFRFGKNPFQKHTKKSINLKSVANEDDDESTGSTRGGSQGAVRQKRQVRSRS